jgi:hypothetical protein
MQALVVFLAVLHPATPPDVAREPWASKAHPQDVARRHVEDVTAARHTYAVTQGGTMDGTNCRSPVGGEFAIWEQLPGDGTRLALRWKPGPRGEKPVRYRVYGSDEKGFTVSDQAYTVNVGVSDLPRKFAANFTAETTGTELIVLGPGLDVPNANNRFRITGGR